MKSLDEGLEIISELAAQVNNEESVSRKAYIPKVLEIQKQMIINCRTGNLLLIMTVEDFNHDYVKRRIIIASIYT